MFILFVYRWTKSHSKKCWVVLTQFWVKYGQFGSNMDKVTNPIVGLKNPYLTQNWVKITQHFF